MKPLYYGTSTHDIIKLANGTAGYEIYAFDGNDHVDGTDFADYIDGGAGTDYILAGKGNDIVVGGDGNDYLYGMEGNDILYGGFGFDIVSGGAGNDVLFGGPGDKADGTSNLLKGGDGDDTLYGGNWGDNMVGGTGKDVFVYDLSDQQPATIGIQRVWDFETSTRTSVSGRLAAVDKLDVSEFLPFYLYGDISAAEAISKGYIYWAQHAGETPGDMDTTVYFDPDGGAHGPSDYALFELEGVKATELSAAHFIV